MCALAFVCAYACVRARACLCIHYLVFIFPVTASENFLVLRSLSSQLFLAIHLHSDITLESFYSQSCVPFFLSSSLYLPLSLSLRLSVHNPAEYLFCLPNLSKNQHKSSREYGGKDREGRRYVLNDDDDDSDNEDDDDDDFDDDDDDYDDDEDDDDDDVDDDP